MWRVVEKKVSMRVLVIGGTSFIGPSVVRRLVETGHDVTVFNRGQTQADLPEGVRRVTGQRESIGEFRDEFEKLAPDVAIDMRPMTEPEIRLVVDAVKGIVSRVVAISSMDVYRAFGRLIGIEPGPPVDLPLNEDSLLREKLFPYRSEDGRSSDDPDAWRDEYDKILVERVVLGDPDLPGTMLRLPMVYGPRDRQHRFRSFVKRMDDDRPAIALSESYAGWRSSWGYVDDIAAAIALAATDERAVGKVYTLSETEHPTMAEIAALLAERIGWNGKIVTVPDEARPSGMNTEQDLVGDSSRIRRELGYSEITPRDEAWERTIAWERDGGPEINPDDFDYAAEDELLQRYG